MQPAPAVDLRKHPRLLVQAAVQLDLGSASIEARTRDISWGGAFIETTKPLPPNALVALTLQIPDAEDPLEFDARVTHHRPGGIGVEFLTVTERHRPALASFLEHLSCGDEILS